MVAPVSISAGLLTLLACGLVLNPAVRAVIGLAADRLIGSKEFLAYAVPIDMAVATFAFVRTGAAITPTQKQLVATAEIIFAAIPTGLMFGLALVPWSRTSTAAHPFSFGHRALEYWRAVWWRCSSKGTAPPVSVIHEVWFGQCSAPRSTNRNSCVVAQGQANWYLPRARTGVAG